MREDKNPDFYDSDSSSYDELRWNSKGGAFTNRAQQAIVQELCADWNDGRILEIGSGTARFTIPLCEKNNRMVLLDIAASMLDVAKENIQEAGLIDRVEDFVTGSIYELPFDDASFDHAITLNVLNHLEEPANAIRQLARVIKPGSTLLFNYANLQSYYWPVGRRINRRSRAIGQDVYSSWEKPSFIRRAVDEAGLDLVACLGNVHVPRGLDRRRALLPVVKLLDAISRRAPLRRLAPIHFCLCRKRGDGTSC